MRYQEKSQTLIAINDQRMKVKYDVDDDRNETFDDDFDFLRK